MNSEMADSAVDRPPQQTTVDILGVHVEIIDFAGMLRQIETWIKEGDAIRRKGHAQPPICRQICTVNPEFIVDALHNPHFANAINAADLRVPDGIGVLWAARQQGVRLPERVTGSDGIYRICERAAAQGWRVFLLGAGPGVALETAMRLRQRYPRLVVCGTFSGDPTAASWPAIHEYVTATRPHILFVAFGHPRQDIWIHDHRQEFPSDIAIGVGGAFDFVAGVTRRAPPWIRRLNMEWLYRLVREPWRWRRMLKLPIFVAMVMVTYGFRSKRRTGWQSPGPSL